MIPAEEHATTYRVEVSGWDDHKSFFVENSELDWSEEFGKRVTLNRTLTDGSVIFLRLLQPMTNERALPVAYAAELIARNDRGQRQFRLRPIAVSSRPARRTVPLTASPISSETKQSARTRTDNPPLNSLPLTAGGASRPLRS